MAEWGRPTASTSATANSAAYRERRRGDGGNQSGVRATGCKTEGTCPLTYQSTCLRETHFLNLSSSRPYWS